MSSQIIFFTTTALGILLFILMANPIKKEKGYSAFLSLGFLALFYLMGEVAQVTRVPFYVIRNWSSDIGFVPMGMIATLGLTYFLGFKGNKKILLVVAGLILCIFCIIHEYFQIEFDALYPGKSQGSVPGFSGRGDMLDIVAYVTATIASMIFLSGIPEESLQKVLPRTKTAR